MRQLLLLSLSVAVVGCSESHGRLGDAGSTDGGECGPEPFLFCVSDCGSDAGLPPICSDGAWVCPPGTRDAGECPPTCWGPAPPGCVCDRGEWRCDATCPPDLNPWDPSHPSNACWVEGAECTSGGTDPCGGGMWCTCRGGRWECAVAEPDPVCYCGREPSEGDRCVEEGASCGECCPLPGGWPAMTCSGGRWTAAECGDVLCPPAPSLPCPANTASIAGRACDLEGASCGDECCGDHVVCTGGRWEPQTGVPCVWCSAWECGDGSCHDGELCHETCGPADGPAYFCEPTPEGCSSCDCIPLWGTQRCEMIDGHPHVIDLGLCG